MQSHRYRGWRAILAMGALGVIATPVAASVNDDPEVVFEWNQLLQSNIPPTAGLFSFRYFAAVSMAASTSRSS